MCTCHTVAELDFGSQPTVACDYLSHLTLLLPLLLVITEVSVAPVMLGRRVSEGLKMTSRRPSTHWPFCGLWPSSGPSSNLQYRFPVSAVGLDTSPRPKSHQLCLFDVTRTSVATLRTPWVFAVWQLRATAAAAAAAAAAAPAAAAAAAAMA